MTLTDVERAAQSVRQDLGESSRTLIDVYSVAQQRGANVLLAPIADGPEGCYGRVRNQPWIFANTVGRQDLSGWLDRSRLRFTLAHELGHMTLEHGAKVDVRVETGNSVRGDEREANHFAAELLLPLEGLRWYLDVHRIANVTAIDQLVNLAGHFGTSCSVALYRIDQADRISRTYKSQMTKALSQREHLSAERKIRLRSYTDSLKELGALAPDRRYRPPASTFDRVVQAWSSGLLSTEAASEYQVGS